MATRRPSMSSSLTKRDKYLRRKYNITEEEYRLILYEQRGRCGACKRHQREFKTRLAVDHDHLTGLVRGLLCYHCNRWVIGKHRPEKIIGAAEYLVKLPARRILTDGRCVTERRKRGRTKA